MIDLQIEYPDGKTTKITLKTGVFQIGRTKENDIVIENDTISRVHAELAVCKEQIRIKDLNSSSGTHLNGKLCTFEKKVQLGDKILLGLVNLSIGPAEAGQIEPDPEETRAFQKEELSSVLQDLLTEQQDQASKNKSIIIGLCCLILALCLYIWLG